MLYTIKANFDTIIDGQKVTNGDTLATIESELPIGNVLSMAAFNSCSIEPVKSKDKPKILARESVGADSVVSESDSPSPEPSVDPDALNDEDQIEDEQTPPPAAPADPEPAPEAVSIDPSFEGLTPKFARILTAQGIASRDALAKFLADGNDLLDLDDIGSKTAKQIVAWLEI